MSAWGAYGRMSERPALLSDICTNATRLQRRTSIATVFSETMELKHEDRRPIAPCPFHADRTPSFYVFDDHYHCFGCGVTGDTFTWLKQVGGITFGGTVAHLNSDVEAVMATTPKHAISVGRRGKLLSAVCLRKAIESLKQRSCPGSGRW